MAKVFFKKSHCPLPSHFLSASALEIDNEYKRRQHAVVFAAKAVKTVLDDDNDEEAEND